MLVLDDAVAGGAAPLVVGGCFTAADFVAVATAGRGAAGAEIKIFPLRLANCSGVRSLSLSTKF